jgi:hypothetical protein
LNYKKVGTFFSGIVFLIIILILAGPLIIIYGLYLMKIISIPFLILINFYEMVYISFWCSIFSLVILFITFKHLKLFSLFVNIIISVIISLNIAIFGGLYEAESFIEKQALLQLNKKPSYINVCLKSTLQVCPFRCENICIYPHSLIEKDERCYYWSFKERKFLILPESICSNVR